MFDKISIEATLPALSVLPIVLNILTRRYSSAYIQGLRSKIVRGGTAKFIRVNHLEAKMRVPIYAGTGELYYEEAILLTTHHPRAEYDKLISLPSRKYKFSERILDLESCYSYLLRMGIKIPLINSSNVRLEEGEEVDVYRCTDNRRNLEIVSDSKDLIEAELNHISYTKYYIIPWVVYILSALIYLYHMRWGLLSPTP